MSIQGEGPFVGMKAYFIRVVGCNLSCSWCDSRYTWDPDVLDRGYTYTFEDFSRDVKKAPLVVLTGGEPLLYSRVFSSWIPSCEAEVLFQFETNATHPPVLVEDPRVYYVLSPKLPSSGLEDAVRLEILKEYMPLMEEGRAFLKFVISDPIEDRRSIAQILDSLDIPHELRYRCVYLMPEGTTKDLPMAEDTVRLALDMGLRYTDRLHIRIWGNKRGV